MSRNLTIDPVDALQGGASVPSVRQYNDDLGDEKDGIYLGRVYDFERKRVGGRLFYSGERHALIVGPSGTGKTARIVVPNLLMLEDRSIFVVDPKGELAAMTAEYRSRNRGKERDVYVINPFDLVHKDFEGYDDLESCGFNPLAHLDPEADSFSTEVSELADAVVKIAEGKDAHWDESANALLSCLIMYATIKAKENDQVATMADVRKLLCAYSEGPKASNRQKGRGIPAICLEMAKYKNHVGLANMSQQFIDWSVEKSGIQSTLMRHTKRFDDPPIMRDMAKTGPDFREMKRRPMTVYVVCPPDKLIQHSMWLRLVITAAMQKVLRYRAAGEPKALFILDEFAAIGRLEIIESLWSQVRGYGIQIMPCVQGLTQLKQIYKDGWESFIASAGAVLSFTPNDPSTVDWLSRRGGERDKITMSYNESESSNGPSLIGVVKQGDFGSHSRSRSTNYNTQRTPLLDPHKLYGLQAGFTLVGIELLDNLIFGYAPLWTNIRRCKARARPNPYHGGTMRQSKKSA